MTPSGSAQSYGRERKSCNRRHSTSDIPGGIPPSLGRQLSLGKDRPSIVALGGSVVYGIFQSYPSFRIHPRSRPHLGVDRNALQLTIGGEPPSHGAGCKRSRLRSLRRLSGHQETLRSIEGAPKHGCPHYLAT